MLNDIKVMGRLTKDPELRTTASGKNVANFTLANDRDFQRDTTDFFNCVAWEKWADFSSRHLHKGQLVVVGGSMQQRRWEDKNGEKKKDWDLIVGHVWFAESKKPSEVVTSALEELEDDGEIPF